jgi:hypothetical protein
VSVLSSTATAAEDSTDTVSSLGTEKVGQKKDRKRGQSSIQECFSLELSSVLNGTVSRNYKIMRGLHPLLQFQIG